MSVLTVEQVRAEVARIAGLSPDYEKQHSLEDNLWFEVLKAIACDGYSAAACGELARAALGTMALDFERVCA